VTPDEWLLDQFDRHGRAHRDGHARRIIAILDDHPSTECIDEPCRYWSGASAWPAPLRGRNIDPDRTPL